MGRQSASKKKDTSKARAAKGTKALAVLSKSPKVGSTDAQRPRPKPKPAYKAAAAAGDAEKLASAALMMLGGDKRLGQNGARGSNDDDNEVEAQPFSIYNTPSQSQTNP